MTTSLSRIRPSGRASGAGRSCGTRAPTPVVRSRPSTGRGIRSTSAARCCIQRRGAGDPTMTTSGAVIWRASRTPKALRRSRCARRIRASIRGAAWGPGADWALGQLPALCGALDDRAGFDGSRHPLIAEAHRRNPGLRLSRTDLVFDALASSIFEQKVTGMQAFGAWRRIVTWFGERAPGPTPRPMFAPPSIDGLAAHPVVGVAPRGARAAAGAHRRRVRTPRRLDRCAPSREAPDGDGARPRADEPPRRRACGRPPRPASGRSATPTP